MELIKILKALDDENRLKMIYILSEYKFCQVHLQDLIGINQANISRNIKKLYEAGIINYELSNRKNRYFVTKEFQKEYEVIYLKVKEEYKNSDINKHLKSLEHDCEVLNNG